MYIHYTHINIYLTTCTLTVQRFLTVRYLARKNTENLSEARALLPPRPSPPHSRYARRDENESWKSPKHFQPWMYRVVWEKDKNNKKKDFFQFIFFPTPPLTISLRVLHCAGSEVRTELERLERNLERNRSCSGDRTLVSTLSSAQVAFYILI